MKAFVPLGLFLLAAIGWVANIVKLAMWTSFDPLTGIAVVRIIGVFIPPLGAILGYIPT